MQYNIIDLLLFFIIYSFIGFLTESLFRTLVTKKLTVSRGFLTNYFCPLYGICAVMVIQIFTIFEITIDNRSISLFYSTIVSMAVITLFEYITGLTLHRVFNCRLWDYSENKCNLQAYVCLEFSLMWGISAIILSSFIHPLIEVAVISIPAAEKYIFMYFTLSILIINASLNMRKLHHTHM